jgi:hypothetical protein
LNSKLKLDKRVTIIGFSLPEHDQYIRQPMYWFIRNFHNFQDEVIGRKSKLKIIDLQNTDEKQEEFKKRYRFVDQTKTDYYFKGFNEEALNFIFDEEYS